MSKPNVQQTLLVLRQLVKDRQLNRAESIARHLRESYPRRADANDALGVVLSAGRKYAEAAAYCGRAVESEPRNTVYLMNLGRNLLEMNRIIEAEPLLLRAMALDPQLYLAPWTLGTFYFIISRGDRALGYYEKAMALAPAAMQPVIRHEMANCLFATGQMTEASSLLRANLAVPMLRAKTIANLAEIAGGTVESPEYALVETELRRGDLAIEDRRALLLQKGILLANSRRYDEAYAIIQSAKPPAPGAAELSAFNREVDGRIAAFTAERIERLARLYGHPSDRQVFVVGMPRSGTTLIEQIVAAHSQAGGAGELRSMAEISEVIRGGGAYGDLGVALEDASLGKVRALADDYVALTDYLAPGKLRVVDKMPHNFRNIGEIAILFPRARIIHCTRHPADTFLSAFQKQMNAGHAYSYSPATYAGHYADYLRLMRHWHEVLPGRIFTLKYEELTADPRAVVGRLLDFLGLDWEEACLNFHQTASAIRTYSRVQVRQAINANSVGRWRNYTRQLEPLLERLAGESPLSPSPAGALSD